jgi:hypothetical protein
MERSFARQGAGGVTEGGGGFAARVAGFGAGTGAKAPQKMGRTA